MDSKLFLISALIFFSNSPISILAQINTPCSPTMLSTASGCMSFLTGNGTTSPTSGCCEALKSLTGTGMDCLCLIVTASVPINLPINRTLAISLPRACGMSGVPVQCKASVAPLPAPGPAFLGPTISPTDTQTPEGPSSFGPTNDPTTSMSPNSGDGDYNESDNNGGGSRTTTITPPPAAVPSSSDSVKFSLLLFAFAFEILSSFF